MTIFVNAKEKIITVQSRALPCRIGKDGFIDQAQGTEGDGKTPLGNYILRFGLYRADRLPPPQSPLTFRPLRRDDGWCDAADDIAYNRFIKTPYPASHEVLWREDGVYDILLVMSHNDSPPIAGLGSAVFIHIAQPDDRQTLGCIALDPDSMVALLPHLSVGQTVSVREV